MQRSETYRCAWVISAASGEAGVATGPRTIIITPGRPPDLPQEASPAGCRQDG